MTEVVVVLVPGPQGAPGADLTERLDELEARVAALEPPPEPDAPTFTSITPDTASNATQPHTITILGTGFDGVDYVLLGGVAGAILGVDLARVSDTELTWTFNPISLEVPPGTYDLEFYDHADPDKTLLLSVPDAFVVAGPPAPRIEIVSVEPSTGIEIGDPMILTLSGETDHAYPILIDGESPATLDYVTPGDTTVLSFLAPDYGNSGLLTPGDYTLSVYYDGDGPEDTTVITYGPHVATFTSITPDQGLPSTPVVVLGTEFTDATSLGFWYAEGGVFEPGQAFEVISDTEIHVEAIHFREGSSPLDIQIGFADSARNLVVPDAFTVLLAPPPPSIDGMNPESGSTAGGETVYLTGQNFNGATEVFIDAHEPVASFEVLDNADIMLVTPAHAAGVVHFGVTTPAGEYQTLVDFTFA